ncbi:unnamed protein product [Allacma fusca]|uniref:Peptidase M12A domain-containing protein n=1 Tax=Allacma fusca TaxID=39272 RepID=A0A8J2L3H4_9HEXA|nr:unnamed protein product [Allacma fusca]
MQFILESLTARTFPVKRSAMYTGEDSSSSSEEAYELDGGQEFHSERSASDPEYGPFFEGDMLNNPYERNGIPDDKYRWKLGKVKYFVDDAFTLKESEFIYKAVEDIQSNTCINFQEMTNDDDHIGNGPGYLCYDQLEKRECIEEIQF